MTIIIVLLSSGSFLIALTLAIQIKHVEPNIISVLKYNLYILPLILAANVFLGMGFIKGQQVIKNLPLLVAGQTFIYYIMILLFSLTILQEEINIFRALLGYILIVAGIWFLKS